jgi:hypothetical protein
VTGVTLKVGDQFDYYEETVEDKVIGYEDHCWNEPILLGLSSERRCAKKAIITQVKTRFPKFKSSVMSIKESDALFALLMKNAVNNAKPLMVQSADPSSVDRHQVGQWRRFEPPNTAHFGEKRDHRSRL